MAKGNHDNPNPYAGLSGGSGQTSAKQGQRAGRRPLDMAPAAIVHRIRGVGGFSFTGQPSDGETVTITSNEGLPATFEFESGGGVAAGNIPVTIGASTSDTADNLFSAMFTIPIGPDFGLQPIRHSDPGGVELVALAAAGREGIGATMSETATGVDAVNVAGDVPHGSPKIAAQTRTPNAQELADGVMLLVFDFVPRGHLLAIRDSSNVLKAFDGASSSDGLFATVVVSNDGASVPFAAGDTVSVLAWAESVSWENTVVFD